jgi:hypothetical protein
MAVVPYHTRWAQANSGVWQRRAYAAQTEDWRSHPGGRQGCTVPEGRSVRRHCAAPCSSPSGPLQWPPRPPEHLKDYGLGDGVIEDDRERGAMKLRMSSQHIIIQIVL